METNVPERADKAVAGDLPRLTEEEREQVLMADLERESDLSACVRVASENAITHLDAADSRISVAVQALRNQDCDVDADVADVLNDAWSAIEEARTHIRALPKSASYRPVQTVVSQRATLAASLPNHYIDRALDEQNQRLFSAQAIIESVAEALHQRFGGDWPRDIPEYPRALRNASAMIQEAYANLEMMCLDQRAQQLQEQDEARTNAAEALEAVHG